MEFVQSKKVNSHVERHLIKPVKQDHPGPLQSLQFLISKSQK